MRGSSKQSGRVGLVALLALGLLSATFVALAPGPAGAATVTQVITASADTYVDSSAPSTPRGSQSTLSADASPTRYIFVRFNLSAVTGTITAATLRLHTQNNSNAPSPAGGTVRSITSNSWSEASTTYNNRPSTSGTIVGSFGSVARNTWYQMNALSVVAPGGVLNLSIVSTNTDGAYYDSRETGANAPQLVLTIETAAPNTLTLTPTGDTYVENGTAAATNFGTATTISADNSPVRQILLRFNLATMTTVGSARLRLHVANNSNGPSPFGGTVTRVTGTWAETTTTYNNRPALGTTVAAFGAVSQNSWVEVDVTSAVTAGAVLNLAITSNNTDGAYYDSRETGANSPQLIVTTTTPPSTTTTTTTTTPTTTSTTTTSTTTTRPTTTSTTTTRPTTTSTTTTRPTTTSTTTTTPPPSGIVIAAVGDMVCAPTSPVTSTTCRQLSVSNLIHNDASVQHFLALGDLQYPNGELANFQTAYQASFGRFKAKTKPAPGNHEYNTTNASGYYTYFGSLAGDPTKGYYSFDVGTTWHIVALNSNCTFVSCAVGSAQEQWLRADLAASTRPCTIAFWHHPRYTSSSRGDNTGVDPLWRAVADDGAELVLAGHEHVYERFAPMNAAGAADANGVRSLIVGTGGNSLGSFSTTHANSLLRLRAFGVLKLTLGTNSYSWQMVNESGTVLDSGTGTCH